jgi:hypothetical protein
MTSTPAALSTHPPSRELPRLSVPLSPEAVLQKLETASRRGKFPGFVSTGTGRQFRVRDFGGPFESVLETSLRGGNPSGTELQFRLRLRPTLIWVYLVVLMATVWPGVWLTDSMLRTYFPGYDYHTWMWYLPLTAPVVPWAMWTTIRKSRRRGQEAVGAVLDRLSELLGGRLANGSVRVEPRSADIASETEVEPAPAA